MVTAVEPQLLRGVDHARAAAAFVFHLVAQICDLGARALAGELFLQVGRDTRIVGLDRRLDGADLDQRRAELALHRLAHLAGRQRKCRVRDGRVEDGRFGDEAEIDIGRLELALLGDVVERRSRGDAAARGLGFLHVREHDLRDLALLGRAELVLAQLEQFLRVLIGDLRPLADVFGRDRDKGDLAIFGRAELGFVLVEIGGERLGRRRLDGAGLCRAKPQIVDRALLVLEMVQRLQQRLRRLESGRHRAGELTPQRHPALVGEIAPFGEAVLADDGLEARGIEAAAEAFEIGIGIDHAHGLGVGLPEPELPRLLVERGLGDDLLQHLAVEAERARLLLGQGTAEPTPDLLNPVGVDLAELVRGDFGVADLGQGRLAKTPEDVGDAPDAEGDDQYAHHHGHDGLAEPV